MFERPSGIPAESGCYLFRNERGVVIYVGKARSLSQRLGNYFQRPSALDFKTRTLMDEAVNVEWIVTHSEVDALILENELIKTHQPRYNMRLKDDKSFPFLALDFRTPFARPYTTRSSHVKGVTYYGPFAHVRPLKRTIDELLQAYPLRSCSDAKFDDHQRRGRPCLLYDVGKCSGPCVGAIDEARYGELVESFGAFFDGEVATLRRRLEARMAQCSSERDYEGAARARDGLAALENAAQTQRIVLDDSSDLDALSLARSGSRAAVVLFRVRHGRVVGRHALLLDLSFDESDAEIVERSLGEFYVKADDVPRTVVVDEALATSEVSVEFLTRLREAPVALREAQRGKRRHLLEMVRKDAEEVLRVDSLRREHDHNVRSRALSELGTALALARPPYRVECFDMSHLQGTNYVGSMVVFEDAMAKKSDYRQFNVKTVLGNDDVGAMREVVRRRLEHWSDAGGDAKFPNADLIIIDGGVGQLNAALAAQQDVAPRADAAQFVALAKREELLYRPQQGEPVALERGSESLYLVQRVRDEAHRFAISFHRSKRGRAMVSSTLDGVSGLGPSRQKLVMASFGSLEALRRASVHEIAAVPGVPEAVARTLYDHLHGAPSPRLTKEVSENE
jgi:excinuclease ABC subunit C